MTSITSGSGIAGMLSPNERMKQQLTSAISSGKIKSTDETALSGALDDIDTAMKAGGPPSRGANGKDSPKEKIGSLIDKEVSDGKLTEDQATEMKSMFADAAQRMGGAHGPHGAGGPPPKPTDDDDTTSDALDALTSASTSTSTSAFPSTTSETTSASGAQDTMSALVDFLTSLQNSKDQKSPYSSDGSRTGARSDTLSSLIVDTKI